MRVITAIGHWEPLRTDLWSDSRAGGRIGISGPMYQEHEMTNCAGVTHLAWAGIKSTNMNYETWISHLPLCIRVSQRKDVTILMTMDVLRVEHRFYLDLVHFICLFFMSQCRCVWVSRCGGRAGRNTSDMATRPRVTFVTRVTWSSQPCHTHMVRPSL